MFLSGDLIIPRHYKNWKNIKNKIPDMLNTKREKGRLDNPFFFKTKILKVLSFPHLFFLNNKILGTKHPTTQTIYTKGVIKI